MAALTQSAPPDALVEDPVRVAAVPEGVRLRRVVLPAGQSGGPAVRFVFLLAPAFRTGWQR